MGIVGRIGLSAYNVACAPTRATVEEMAPMMMAVFMFGSTSETGCVINRAVNLG